MSRPTTTRRARLGWALAAVALLAAPAAEVFACPVCFGQTDHPIMEGLQASIIFMVGVTYSVIIGGATAFFLLRRRARRMAETATD